MGDENGISMAQKMLGMYKVLFKVDYSQKDFDDVRPGFFATEMSFTFLDWLIIDKILEERDFDLSNIDEEQMLQ